MTRDHAKAVLCLVALQIASACASPPPDSGGTREAGDTVDAATTLRRLTSLPGHETDATVSPDGRRIAFVSESGAESEIFVVDIAGGVPEPIDPAPESREDNPVWSPDGQRVAFVSDRGGQRAIWLSDLTGEPSRRLTGPALRASRPRWSPDGRQIAFNGLTGEAEHVWLLTLTQGPPRQLTTGPGRHYQYGWTPDGQRLLALYIDGSVHDIHSIDPADGSTVPLLEHPDEEYWPSWSPDGRQIAFYTTWGDRMTDIWTLELSQHEPRAITTHPGEDFMPRWSPDGQWLAFHSDRRSKSGLWLAPATGGSTLGGEPLPLVLSGRVPGPVTWSPDSRQIVLSYLRTKAQLFEIPVSRGAAMPLSDGSYNIFNPTVASDGRIAFDSDRWNSERDLLLWDLDAGEAVSLTREIPNNGYATWSPDGERIAYKGSSGGGPRTNQIWLMDPREPDGRRQLTDHGYVRWPVWCGDEIVFRYEDPSLETDQRGQIWAVPTAGGPSRQLTRSEGRKTPSDCTPDGRRLLFSVEQREGHETTVIVVLEHRHGSQPALETEIGYGEGGRWSPDQTRIAFLSSREGWCDLYVTDDRGDSNVRVTQNRDLRIVARLVDGRQATGLCSQPR